MHLQSFLSTMALIALTTALPLNINLGAYSPALVVGDGAISFEEGEGVEGLVGALQGAAVNEAAGRAQQAPVAPPTQESVSPDVQAAQVVSTNTPILTEPAGFPEPGSRPKGQTKELDPRLSSTATTTTATTDEKAVPAKAKRDLAGFDRALRFAEAALTKGPKIELGTGAHGSGVGIIVDNNPPVAAAAGEGGAAVVVVEGRNNNGIVVE